MYLFCLLVKYLNEYLLERSEKLNKEGSWCKKEIYFLLLSPTSGSEIWVWWTLYTIQSYHSSCFQVVDFNYYYCLRFRPYILFKVTSGLEPGYSSEKGLANSDTKELLQPCSPACEVPVISRKEECTSGTDSYFSRPLWFHGAQQCRKKTHKPCKESNVPSSLTNSLLWELWWVTSLLPNTYFGQLSEPRHIWVEMLQFCFLQHWTHPLRKNKYAQCSVKSVNLNCELSRKWINPTALFLTWFFLLDHKKFYWTVCM